MRKVIVVMFLCFFYVAAHATLVKKQLGCNYLKDGDYIQSDPCLYLKNKQISIIFNPDYYLTEEDEGLQPLIAIDGKITRLKLVHSSDYLSKVPRNESAFNIKGDSHSYVYQASNIKVEYKKTVVGMVAIQRMKMVFMKLMKNVAIQLIEQRSK